MPPLLATIIYGFGIWILLRLARDDKRRASRAIWLPTIYLLINGSRAPSYWFQIHAGITPDQLLEGSPLDRNIYLVLIVVSVIALLGRQSSVARVMRTNLPICLFIFYCAVSVSWSDYPGVAFKRWIKLVGDFTIVLVALTDRNPSSAIRQILTRVGFVLIPCSILLNKYFPEMSRYYDQWTGRQFISGVATDKNMLGMTCLIYGLGVLWQFIDAYQAERSRKRMRHLIAYGAVLAMTFQLFSAADSMSSLSCFIMGAGLIVATSFFKGACKPVMVNLMVAAVVGLCFSILFLHIGEGAALEKMGRNPTLTGRTEIWAGVLRFSGNPFFGTGFDSFWLGERLKNIWASEGILYGLNEAHNGYLETYLNLGWFGVMLLAIVIVSGYRNILGALRCSNDVAGIKLAFFVAAIVYSFTEVGFRTSCAVWTAFLLAVVAVPNAAISRCLRPPDSEYFVDFEAETEIRRSSEPSAVCALTL